MKNEEKPIANPLVVLREEFDDWAILFDPDSGNAFGLSPTGVYLWKLLDGEHTIDDMLKTLQVDAEAIPKEAGGHLAAFVEELTANGLAGYDVEWGHDDRGCIPPCPTLISEKVADAMQFAYEPPKLINLSGEQAAHGACGSGSGASGNCASGVTASSCCGTGTSGTSYIYGCCGGACVTSGMCENGGCASSNCWSGSTPGGQCSAGTTANYRCNCGSSGACSAGGGVYACSVGA